MDIVINENFYDGLNLYFGSSFNTHIAVPKPIHGLRSRTVEFKHINILAYIA
jgi:hypothetical protein